MTTNEYAATHPAPGSMVRAAGVAAILGGCMATLAAVLLALQPAGCIGAECSTRPMRTTPPDIVATGVMATALIMIGLFGLTRLATRTGKDHRLARSARICGAIGVMVLFAGMLVQATIFRGDMFLMPVVVAVGGLLTLASLALLVTLVFRTRALPRRLTSALGASCVLLAALNEQTAAILFTVPFALTMVAIGVLMVASPPTDARTPVRRRASWVR